MYFRDSDVVIELRLNVNVSDLESVIRMCRPLVQELGAAAVEVETADPDGGRRGFHVSLIVVSAACSGPPGDALALAAGPLQARFRLPKPYFKIAVSAEYGTHGEYDGPERSSGGFTVIGLGARFGRDAADGYPDGLAGVMGAGDSAHRHRKVLAVPCGDTDVVVRLHARLGDPNLGSALRSVLPLVQAAGASALEFLPAADGYAAALLTVAPGDRGLRDAASPLIERFGLDGDHFTVYRRETWTVGALESEPAGDGVHALYARQAIDPFSRFDAFATVAARELVVSESLT
jgi:hypothetical protein